MTLKKTSATLEDWQIKLLDAIAKEPGPLFGASRSFLVRHALNHTFNEKFGHLIEGKKNEGDDDDDD